MAWLRNRRFPANFDPTFVPTFPVTLIPDHPLVNGLCGLYLSADAIDYSPYGNNGVPTTKIPGTVSLGQGGTLMSFNGTNQAMVGGGKGLNVNFATISVWLYGTTGSSMIPFSIGTSTNYAMYFQVTPGAQATLGCFTTVTNATVSSVSPLPVGVLTHLCGTFNSSANLLQCYVNGVPTANTATGGGALRGVSEIVLGGLVSSSSISYYSQYIASASVYNRALTSGEVYALYREPYDMLAPVARRTYSKSQLVPDSLSISATAPKPSASGSIQGTDSVGVAATAPKPTAAVHLAKGESLHVAATTHAPTAALSAKIIDVVAIAATAPKPNAAISGKTGDITVVRATTLKPNAATLVTVGNVAAVHATAAKPVAAIAATASLAVTAKATTRKPSAAANLEQSKSLSVAATTHPPTAKVLIGSKYAAAVVARTPMPTARVSAMMQTKMAVATTAPAPHASVVLEKGETVSFVKALTPVPNSQIFAFQQFGHVAATTLPPVVDFSADKGESLLISATTILPNRGIGSAEGEASMISAVTPMPNLTATALVAAMPPDRDMIVLSMLGNIAAKASVSAT